MRKLSDLKCAVAAECRKALPKSIAELAPHIDELRELASPTPEQRILLALLFAQYPKALPPAPPPPAPAAASASAVTVLPGVGAISTEELVALIAFAKQAKDAAAKPAAPAATETATPGNGA